MIGAYVERIRFGAMLAFSGAWLLIVYVPVAHWIWGGGWLAQRHVMDFAGGLVVHATAGVSALVAALMIGPRDGFPHDLRPPHNPGMTMTGAAMLWVGWYGFNGGSALAANSDAAMAILATHISASAAGLVWALIERIRFGRSSMVGLITGVVAGLATITPASGYVSPLAALALGALGSVVCFAAVELVKQRLKIDDSLDVLAVHGVGGILGSVLVAVLASPALGGAGYAPGVTMTGQLGSQLLATGVVIAWALIGSFLILLAVRAIFGLRAADNEIEEGLDFAHHGERAHSI
jgi:Amt family ammonium transporter